MWHGVFQHFATDTISFENRVSKMFPRTVSWKSLLGDCCVVIEVFIIIKQINCLFLIRLLSKVAGKGNTAEISVFYSGRHDTELTPLPRTGMFSKNWRAILVEVAGPKAPHRIPLQTSHLLRTTIYFYKTPPSKGHVLYLIGEGKSSSSSSNYPFANLKSFNRTRKGKQPIYSCQTLSQAYVRSLLVYSKCQQYKWAYKGRYMIVYQLFILMQT